ncbi:MAG: MFS transporter [Dehalococcoidia bacterium]|jgi:MFS family permease
MTGKTQGGSFYGWWLLPVLCLVYSIPIGFALYGPPVINTFMADALKWPRGEINLGYSIIGLMLGVGALLIPWMMDRFGPRKTLAIGAVIAAISSILVALLGHISVTLNGHIYPIAYWVICFFVGLGVSFGTVVPVQALVMLWFNMRRALAMGLVLGGGAVGLHLPADHKRCHRKIRGRLAHRMVLNRTGLFRRSGHSHSGCPQPAGGPGPTS